MCHTTQHKIRMDLLSNRTTHFVPHDKIFTNILLCNCVNTPLTHYADTDTRRRIRRTSTACARRCRSFRRKDHGRRRQVPPDGSAASSSRALTTFRPSIPPSFTRDGLRPRVRRPASSTRASSSSKAKLRLPLPLRCRYRGRKDRFYETLLRPKSFRTNFCLCVTA
jgi:hypothetical protein